LGPILNEDENEVLNLTPEPRRLQVRHTHPQEGGDGQSRPGKKASPILISFQKFEFALKISNGFSLSTIFLSPSASDSSLIQTHDLGMMR
jgi:hypothetical protein